MAVVRQSKSKGRGPEPRAFTDADAQKFLKRGYEAMHAKNFEEAGNCSVLVLKYRPKEIGAHFLIGLVSAEMAKWPMARQAFQNVVSLDEKHAAGWAQLARSFVILGQYANAEKALSSVVELKPTDPLVQDVIGTVFSLIGDQNQALFWYDKACNVSQNPLFELSRAKAYTFLGRLKEAEASLHIVLKANADAAQAHWMLSRVQKTIDTNHIAQMEKLSAATPANSPSQPFLKYAIAKEYEDLGDWKNAFHAYEAGAAARRREVTFDEAAEERLFAALKETYTKTWFESLPEGSDDRSPIFVIGQPRTGTTLIERIMTAHSDVHSAGELQQFGMAIKRVTEVVSPGPVQAEAIIKSQSIDLKKLAAMYLNTTKNMRGESPRFVDKMPVNYLYAPLIAAAFPNAKIIHVVRDPMDSCFASYKQLFADAYYHSYDQEEMARHHARYRDLMQHWHEVLGDRILDVHYEDVVQNTKENAERIMQYLELDWQDEVLDFHTQKSAVTTASAAQVREKAHTRSVGRWREFDVFLQPMKKTLKQRGLFNE
ncbi:tetratricopeptide repeat-containing sulfotransferase family protein [Kordiimonas pumila]|uniref:Tetratricopeptide repeat-containing sulfotransferase family protein n=1 Tax=Kordiimonas pumila TaxID=2161677 RepID=A0ABV7D2W7_9PROT|nr:sulfotransferase [Kordiimonas pumila]